MITAGHRVNKSCTAHRADGSSTNKRVPARRGSIFCEGPYEHRMCVFHADLLAPPVIGKAFSFYKKGIWLCFIDHRLKKEKMGVVMYKKKNVVRNTRVDFIKGVLV